MPSLRQPNQQSTVRELWNNQKIHMAPYNSTHRSTHPLLSSQLQWLLESWITTDELYGAIFMFFFWCCSPAILGVYFITARLVGFETTEMYCGRQNFIWLSISIGGGDNDCFLLYGWTDPLRQTNICSYCTVFILFVYKSLFHFLSFYYIVYFLLLLLFL